MDLPIPTKSIDWGVAHQAQPGQRVSGDLHLVVPYENGVLLALVDGIGHGPGALDTAKVATAALRESPVAEPTAQIARCHEALRQTRGVVLTVASLSLSDNTLTWCGVGDVEALHFRTGCEAPPRSRAPLRGGTVGAQLPPLQTETTALRRGDLIIMVTDGIGWGFETDFPSKAPPQRIADHIIDRHSKGTDDACALVVRYLGADSDE